MMKMKNIKKRIYSVLLAMTMLVPMYIPAYASDSAEEDLYSAHAMTAKGLIEALNIESAIPEDMNEAVNNGEFSYTLLHILKSNPENEEYALNMAKEMSIVLDKNLEAGNELQLQDAVQMCVSATGYNVSIANSVSNFAGIVSFGANLGLLDNMPSYSMTDTLTAKDAYAIIYNVLNTDIMTSNYNGDYYTQQGVTILTDKYNVHRVKDILTGIPSTDLYTGGDFFGTDNVRLGTEIYKSVQSDRDLMLGKNVEAYINYDDEEICYMYPVGNFEAIINYEDVDSVDKDSITYLTESSKHRIKLDSTYDIIYNGKSYRGSDWTSITGKSAELRFLDNDRDGIYEILFITDYRYVMVSAVDFLQKKIYGDNGEVVNLGDDSTDIKLFDSQSGKESQLDSIEADTMLKVQSSIDSSYIRIYICNTTVIGKITSISLDENSISVDGVEYKIDPYYAENMNFTPASGKTYTFYIGDNGKIVRIKNGSSSMRFGYIISIYDAEEDQEPRIRLLDESGKIMIFSLKSSLTVDGVSTKRAGAQALIRSASPLIKYMSNSDDEITKVDTAEESAEDYVDVDTASDNNSLTQYKIDEALTYKSTTKMFGTHFSASSAVIFMVPVDDSIKSDSYYKVTTSSVFVNDRSYDPSVISAYNLDEVRRAKAVVYKSDTSYESVYGDDTKSAVVEKVELVVNEDDEETYQITYFMNNQYTTTMVENDVSLMKASGRMIEAGDVIRFSMDDKTITSLIVDFDAGTMQGNADSSATFNETTSRILQYQYGMIAMYDSGNMLLTQPGVTDASNSENFEWKNTRLVSVPTSGIILVNRYMSGDSVRSTEVRRIEPYEILTYKNSSGNADFALVRQRYMEPSQMIIYRTTY